MRDWYTQWMGKNFDTLNIVGTFNLIYNATFLVEEGVGYALCIDRLLNISEDYPLRFIPLEPRMEYNVSIVWKKDQVFSKASQKFLERLREIL
jgi:DNA-binding transcriptional LysR family regulator